jgi:hypothetical protein
MSNSDDTYVLCSDDEIILEHQDDTNKFKLTFNVLESYEAVVEILQDNFFFDLAKQVNSNIITDSTQSSKDNINYNSLKIITPKDFNFKNTYGEHINLHFVYVVNIINENQAILQNIQNKNTKSDLENIYFNDFGVVITKNNVTSIVISFTFDENVNDTMNKFIALYIKKIFKNVKKYFDMK